MSICSSSPVASSPGAVFNGELITEHLATAAQSGWVTAPWSVAAPFPAAACVSRYTTACSNMRGVGAICWSSWSWSSFLSTGAGMACSADPPSSSDTCSTASTARLSSKISPCRGSRSGEGVAPAEEVAARGRCCSSAVSGSFVEGSVTNAVGLTASAARLSTKTCPSRWSSS